MENSGYDRRGYDYRNDRNRRCKISNRVEWEVILVSVSPTAPTGCFGEHKGGIKRCHAIVQGFPGKGDIRGVESSLKCFSFSENYFIMENAVETMKIKNQGTDGRYSRKLNKEPTLRMNSSFNRRDWIRTSGLRSAAVGAKPTSPGRRAPSTPELRSVRFDRWLAYILIN